MKTVTDEGAVSILSEGSGDTDHSERPFMAQEYVFPLIHLIE